MICQVITSNTLTCWKKLSLIIVKALVQVMYAHKLRRSRKTFCCGSLKSQIGSSVTPRVFPGHVTSNRPFFFLDVVIARPKLLLILLIAEYNGDHLRMLSLKETPKRNQSLALFNIKIKLSIHCGQTTLFKFPTRTFNESLSVGNTQ